MFHKFYENHIVFAFHKRKIILFVIWGLSLLLYSILTMWILPSRHWLHKRKGNTYDFDSWTCISHLCRWLFYCIYVSFQWFFLTLLKRNYCCFITQNKSYLQKESVVFYATSKIQKCYYELWLTVSLSFLYAAVQGSNVIFRTVEVTLHKEGNTFGFVIRGRWWLENMNHQIFLENLSVKYWEWTRNILKKTDVFSTYSCLIIFAPSSL